MKNKVKKDITEALKRLGLAREVSLAEIEKEISRAETSFQSFLVLGILSRIMHFQDDKSAELFIPAVTQWKNYLPCEDLGGSTPEEEMKKYPPGPRESFFISEMMNEYQQRLEDLEEKAESPNAALEFDVQSDFSKFQEQYLSRVPLEQISDLANSHLMNIKEIIMEERRKDGKPEDKIAKIGVKIFAENTAEGTGAKIAAIEDKYINTLEELMNMQQNPGARSKSRVRQIRKQFEQEEPYHRCGPAPHQFYSNYAAVVFLDDGESVEFAISLLDRALSYKPDYDYALEMKKGLKDMA
ncbi:MAG: hypothetical protein WD003_00275 [Candidatus Paceibacterota bacterium]